MLLTLAFAACDTSVTNSGDDIGGIPARAVATGALPTASQIRPDDSFVLANVRVEHSATVTTSHPVYDARTNRTTRTLDIDVPAVDYAVEVGYDSQGKVAASQRTLTPMGDPTRVSISEVRDVRVQDGRVSLYRGSGRKVSTSDIGGDLEIESVLETASPESVTAGLVLSVSEVDALQTRLGSNLRRSSSSVTASETIWADGTAVRVTHRYVPVGSEFVLKQITTETSESHAGTRVESQMTVQFNDVRWYENPTRGDDPIGDPPDDPIGDPPDGGFGTFGTHLDGPDLSDPGWGSPTSNAVPGEDDCERTAIDADGCKDPTPIIGGGVDYCGPRESGANVVWQHGIGSDKSTWGGIARETRVRSYVRCDVALDEEILISLDNNGYESHAEQTAQLKAAVVDRAQRTQEKQFVFVGHSPGGIISRRVAQELWANGKSDLARGVITVGTPHLGANVVRNLPEIGQIGVGLRFVEGQFACRIIRSCDTVYDALVGFMDGVLAAHSGTQAAYDLVPGSPAIQELNAPEEDFETYGIQHYVSKRWAFARVSGDAADDIINGRIAVTILDVATAGAAIGSIINFWIGSKTWGVRLAKIVHDLILADARYHRLTAGPDRTDGVVEGRSQVYPRALDNVQARNPTSHPGETRFESSAVEIRDVMLDRMGLPER